MTPRFSSLFVYAVPLCLALWSCGGDNSPPPPAATAYDQDSNTFDTNAPDYAPLTDTLGNYAANVDYSTSTFVIDLPPSFGNIVMNDSNTGNFTYSPNAGYTGGDTFYWYVTDQFGTSNLAEYQILVGGTGFAVIQVDQQPVASR
jgi:hypothetical protein